MINLRLWLFSQTKSLAGPSRASRLPCGRLRLALTPARGLRQQRCLAEKKNVWFLLAPSTPKSVTYVSERLLPFSPVQTPLAGEREFLRRSASAYTGPG
jgi:hypothetical protein